MSAAKTDNGFSDLMHVNAVRTDNGTAALCIASIYGHLEIARLLLQKDANKLPLLPVVALLSGSLWPPQDAALQALLKF